VDSAIVNNESEFINASPARLLVWPGGGFGDRYDPITGILHDAKGLSAPAASNESQFIALCRAIGCRAIFQVPGEIDSPAYAARIVAYTEQTLGFHPEYWEIGNEPALWHHFNLSWSEWNNSQRLAPTPLQYAEEVAQYGPAMRAVDPTIRILGLPGVGAGGKLENTWIAAVASVDGSWIAGLGIHVYPAGMGPGNATLASFLDSLTGPNSLPHRVPLERATVASVCPSCAGLPIFVTELGSAVLNGTYGSLVAGFPDAVFLGAEVIQALELNLSNIDTFGVRFTNPGSWENATSSVRPSYTLFSELLTHLGGEIQPLGAGATVGGVYAVESTRAGPPTVRDLFMVNSNVSSSVEFEPDSIPGLSGTPAESWVWSSATSQPEPEYWPTGLPSTWTVPPVALLLIETSSPASVPVTVSETGLAPGARWYLTVAGQTLSSPTAQMTLFLPPGGYAVSPSPPEFVANGTRRVEFAPGTITVGTGPTSVSVPFELQYLVVVEVTPGGAGEAVPGSGWYNASAPVHLEAIARPGYTFNAWSFSGPSGYSGRSANGSFSPLGRTLEIATFLAIPQTPASGPVGGNLTVNFGFPSIPIAIPLAALLILAAVVLNFHRRRSGAPSARAGGPVAADSPPGASEVGERSSPGAGGPSVGSVAPSEERQHQVIDRARRLSGRIRELPSGDPHALEAAQALRGALAFMRASRFDEADRSLAEIERELGGAS
jgi:hypothetical protein